MARNAAIDGGLPEYRSPHDGQIYALRNLVEWCFSKIKQSRRLATRYDKTADSYLGFIFLASYYILPCLGRFETDEQVNGNQTVTTEDSFSMTNGSIGHREPPSDTLKSELAIVTGIAKATVAPSQKLKWDEWTGDYSLVRELIESTSAITTSGCTMPAASTAATALTSEFGRRPRARECLLRLPR